MLVLTRKQSQVIKLGDGITITVVSASNGSVKLGIDAPLSVRIMRTECLANCLSSQATDIKTPH